ncbi:MAG: Glycerol-3-phosphate dehydrogenase [NAD(P)+] [Candidatus Omnitrophica bacterium]|nr:Glycerol-3-phosphate dehydrogenase [NAD(P)+] [Candidatus Omnitrophota bacterium]
MKHRDAKIAVIGDGGWGTTLAILLASKGYPVGLWGAFEKYVAEMDRKRENVKFLPGFHIPENVTLTSDLQSALTGAKLVVLAVPSQYMRSVLDRIRATGIKGLEYVSVAKGIEKKSLKVMSQLVEERLGRVPLAVLSGPCIAREIALKMPAAASVASRDAALAARVREVLLTDSFNLFVSEDVLGVELGGSLKNVIAIAAGIVEGLGYGSNTRAALFARGVAEMARLGRKMGARGETFMGLSGLGDLATTCLSPHSRNRWLGERVGKGRTLKQALSETEMVVEGVDTCESAVRLAKRYRVSMPITEAVHSVLFRKKDPKVAVEALMRSHVARELD